jgi:hypothetical protein
MHLCSVVCTKAEELLQVDQLGKHNVNTQLPHKDVWGVVNLLISPLDGSARLASRPTAALRMKQHLEHWVGPTSRANALSGIVPTVSSLQTVD